MSVKTNCPYCHIELETPNEYLGMEVVCSNCNRQFIIPKTGQPQLQASVPPVRPGAVSRPQPALSNPQQESQAAEPQESSSSCSEKSATTYILLGIFLGWIGAHDFYSGRTEMGIIKVVAGTMGFLLGFFTCFITWIFPFGIQIWSIIDVCITRTDADGLPFAK